MFLAKVTGRVVSTVKSEGLEGRKLLIVRRNHDGKAVVAVDSVGAGFGEHVYVCRGKEASFAFQPDTVPSDATIVGIIDSTHVAGKPAETVRQATSGGVDDEDR